MEIISHNYQTGATQVISDHVYGTTGIVRKAHLFKGKKVLFCGVIYMAEDLYTMVDGEAEVFIPEITVKDKEIIKPRCPMISYQGTSDIVTMDHVREARKLNPDKILGYINTPISIKAETDGVYNGTLGLKVVDEIAKNNNGKGKVVFIGDHNVNEWIKAKTIEKYPEFNIISLSSNIYCPPHVTIPADEIIFKWEELVNKYGESKVGLELHAEVNEALRNFGFEKNAYFGGTGGLVDVPKKSNKNIWIVGTIEGVAERLRRETDKEIYSPNAICPNMAYTTPKKVKRAVKLLENEGAVADIIYKYKDFPYYKIIINREEFVEEKNNNLVIPAVRLEIDKEIAKKAKKSLSTLL